MKVLVTGGGGFIGAWVIARLLSEGARARVMELGDDKALLTKVLGAGADEVEWISGDVSRRADVEEAMAGCDRIIHLAGALGPLCETNPARAAEINYVGTLHVFAIANELKMPVVYASTALVHASDGGEPAAPGGHYGVFKMAVELSAGVYAKTHGLPSIGIRPPVVYGYGRTAGNSAGLSLACRAAATGAAYTIPMDGEIEAIHVHDVADAFATAALADYDGAHALNLNGQRFEITDFVAAIRAVVPDAQIDCRGKRHAIAPIRPGGDVADMFPDLSKTSVADGVAATIAQNRDGARS